MPAGYRVEYGGLYASQQESFAQLAVVLLLAFLLGLVDVRRIGLFTLGQYRRTAPPGTGCPFFRP